MKIAILEDNIFFQQKILGLLNFKYDLVNVYDDVDSYDRSETYYDLLLLDINLGKVNGIEYIREHEHKQLYVIYISNYEELMIDTFDSNVLGFIPKNKIDDLLALKIEFVRSKIQKLNLLTLPVLGGKISIRENEILIIYLFEGCVYLLSENKRKYRLIYETLKAAQNDLSHDFIRVNSSEIVNFSKIIRINNLEHLIVLSNNLKIKVSRRKWKDVKLRYASLKTNI